MLNSLVAINLFEWLKKGNLIDIIQDNKVEINHLFSIGSLLRSHIYYQIFNKPTLNNSLAEENKSI